MALGQLDHYPDLIAEGIQPIQNPVDLACIERDGPGNHPGQVEGAGPRIFEEGRIASGSYRSRQMPRMMVFAGSRTSSSFSQLRPPRTGRPVSEGSYARCRPVCACPSTAPGGWPPHRVPFADPRYEAPTPDEIRAVLRQAGLTGSAAGTLLGANGRTIRKWTCSEQGMPYSA